MKKQKKFAKKLAHFNDFRPRMLKKCEIRGNKGGQEVLGASYESTSSASSFSPRLNEEAEEVC